MQSSIKNETGEYTVLQNAEALKNGTLQPSDLPTMKVLSRLVHYFLEVIRGYKYIL